MSDFDDIKAVAKILLADLPEGLALRSVKRTADGYEFDIVRSTEPPPYIEIDDGAFRISQGKPSAWITLAIWVFAIGAIVAILTLR